jgi:hypothetical protein
MPDQHTCASEVVIGSTMLESLRAPRDGECHLLYVVCARAGFGVEPISEFLDDFKIGEWACCANPFVASLGETAAAGSIGSNL